MKKTVIALSIIGLATASVVQAAPQQGTFYFGAKAGSAKFHRGDYARFENSTQAVSKNSVTYGVFGGYQIFNKGNVGVAFELGYDAFGNAQIHKSDRVAAEHTNHGAQLTLKHSYGVLSDLDLYAKAGAALVRSDYNGDSGSLFGSDLKRDHSLKASLLFGAGVEYAATSDLALRLEYQLLHNVGRLKNADGSLVGYNPDIHGITAGFTYRFGKAKPTLLSTAFPEGINKKFTLNSDVSFSFGGNDLHPEAKVALDNIYQQIAKLDNISVAVNGHADRVGDDEVNLKLSERRAEVVAKYLIAKGLNPKNVTFTGYGEAESLTGEDCDAVTDRQSLIACLAPDRRVEIHIEANRKINM